MNRQRLGIAIIVAALLVYLFARREHDAPSAAGAADDGSGAMSSRADDRVSGTGSGRSGAIRAAAIPARAPRGELRLEGVAMDDHDQPMGGVTVKLGGTRTTTTEADGTFAFDELAEGSYNLTAEKDLWYGDSLDNTLDATSDPVEIKLVRGPTLVITVIDAATKKPIEHAKVEVSSRVGLTGSDGVTTLRGVEFGGDGVTVTADAHETLSSDIQAGDDPAATVKKTFALGPGAELAGIVVDPAGKPLADAFVEVEAGKHRHEMVSSDAHGAWSVTALGPGTYLVRASSPIYTTAPDVRVESDGVHGRKGIVLHVATGGSISGIVVDASGKPVAAVDVSVGPKTATTDERGKFIALGLDPDAYDVAAATKLEGSPSQHVKLEKNGHADVRLELRPSSIAGIVVNARGEPVSNVRVSGRSADPRGYGGDSSDDYGHFDFGGLPPGDYDVTAERDGQVRGAKVAPVRVATGTRNVRLVVLDLASITGRVIVDGKPAPYFGFTVTDTPDSVRFDHPQPVRDPSARFEQRGLTPGTWAVVIVGPGFAKKTIENIVVADGQAVDLGDIVVTHGDSVRGHVFDTSGIPVAGATVTISGGGLAREEDEQLRGMLSGTLMAITDGAGAYSIDGFANDDSTHRIIATSPLGSSVERPLAPGELDADLVIASVGAIDGRITNTSKDTFYYLFAVSQLDSELSYSADVDDVGEFHFPALPPGDYEVRLGSRHTVAPIVVTVAANQHTDVVFDLPLQPVDLTVSYAAGCTFVMLHLPSSDAVLTGSACSPDGRATFSQLSPGAYTVCRESDDCAPINLPALPEVTIAL